MIKGFGKRIASDRRNYFFVPRSRLICKRVNEVEYSAIKPWGIRL